MQGDATTLLVGRYRVGPRLARGGMAEVRDAFDERLDRPVAIKVLLPHLAVQPDVRQRFEQEGRSAARLTHPNIVLVYDTGVDDEGRPFLVLERLPGKTLADHIAAGGVDPAWLRSIARDVLGALAAAHAAGIVHRDVKPGNILLTRDGRAKVADFGIAKSMEGSDLTTTGQLIGTPAYLAPERVAGDPATPQSDVYALGVVLYEALAGRKPFQGSTPVAIATAIRAGERPPLPEVCPDAPPDLVRAIERAMQTDPTARFASASEMLDALDPDDATARLAATVDRSDDTVVLDRPPPQQAAPVADRRWPLVPTVLAAVGLLLVAAFLVRAVAGGDGGSPRGELAGDLRRAAAALQPGDGAASADAADSLRDVAEAVEAGGGANAANDLLRDLARWRDDGSLATATAERLRDLLVRVPGANAANFTPPTTAPPPTEPPAGEQEPEKKDVEDDDGGKGRGKGKRGKGGD